MFWSKNKKKYVYPCVPQFCYIKVGYKGIGFTRTCYPDDMTKNIRKIGIPLDTPVLLHKSGIQRGIHYSTVSVMFISFAFTHERKKRLHVRSTRTPRKTLAYSSQNPRLFHAMSTFIPRKKRESCVRYQQSHACSRFPRSLRKRSVERIKRHAKKGLSFRLVQKGKIVKVL